MSREATSSFPGVSASWAWAAAVTSIKSAADHRQFIAEP
jgi:hypothetical protein